jgi:RNA polymerase sigma-70 factor (ECF subfamily)
VAFAQTRLRDDGLAEDVVADVFLRVLTLGDEWTVRTSVRAYLFTAVANQLRDLRAHAVVRARVEEQISRGSTGGGAVPRAVPADERVLYNELEQRVLSVVRRLPPRRRLVFVLNREQGMTYRQIAEMLGIAETTVKTQIGRVVEELATVLDDWRRPTRS